MMEEYTKEYYKEINRTEITQARVIANKITELYHPESVLDIGCGTGLYLAQFDTKCRIGLDFSEAAFDDEVRQIASGLLKVDLTIPNLIYDAKYDVAICFEVIEHIGSENADILVDNIAKSSDILIVTAAPPGQAGLNHVNCQPQKYWDEKFESHGFHRDYHDEFQLVWAVHQVEHTIWLVRNLMVYKK